MDEQESKMIEKQNQMHDHANCLEQVLNILKETNLVDTFPYSQLVKITPIEDEFFKWTPGGNAYTHKSDEEVRSAR